MAIILRHATREQLVARLRERFQSASRQEVWRIAAMLKSHYDAGDFTAAQLRNAFGMTAGQFSTFATKLTNWAAKWEDLKLTQGE